MQDEIEELGNSISNLETNIATVRVNHEDLYKNWGRLGNQEQRRRELLEIQKSNRCNKIDNFRGILHLVNSEEENNIFHSKEKVYYRPNVYVAGFHRTNPKYANVLMLSEWMVEKPYDFSQNWLMAPCPKGSRVLVVACWGKTKFYNKFGRYKFECHTALPGGNHASRKGCTILDAFYCEKNKTVYVLDMLAWKNQPMTDGETEFRQYWLKSQFSEMGASLRTLNRFNSIIFDLIPMVPCTDDALTEALQIYPFYSENIPTVDGLLFYHKHAHYVAGQTPLVGWLYPYMVNELISQDIKIHPTYEEEKPKDYVNQADFIPKFEAELQKNRRGGRRSSNSSMDVDGAKAQAKSKKPAKKTKDDGTKQETMDAEAVEQEAKNTEDNNGTTSVKPKKKGIGKKTKENNSKQDTMDAEAIIGPDTNNAEDKNGATSVKSKKKGTGKKSKENNSRQETMDAEAIDQDSNNTDDKNGAALISVMEPQNIIDETKENNIKQETMDAEDVNDDSTKDTEIKDEVSSVGIDTVAGIKGDCMDSDDILKDFEIIDLPTV